jgi:serine/threonine protein kinase
VQPCSTCGAKIIPGSLFCDSCGASAAQVSVARKLRQSSFTSIKDAKEGLLSPGERIKGKHTYVIEEAIARSGFGATFRAIRVDDEKQFLIKQMIDQASYDQFRSQLLKSFKREANFLRKIKHPAFPRGYEYFERNKSIYLVMDFINGKELAKALEDYRSQNKGKVEDGLIVYLGMQIAEALEIIHLQGYLYRDLKPQNVMLDGISSRVKLIDFGTLYHHSDSSPLIFESEGYTPPDFLSKDKKFTAAGDIYSLGALLYEAAMGDTPKLGNAKAIQDGKRDKRLAEIIIKCLEVEPANRYQKARQVRDELSKLTRKGFWPFVNRNAISPLELSVLPKTLFPPSCTFCEFCGHADPTSQAGYCPKCRVPLRVGRLLIRNEKNEKEKEFYLYSDETIVGSSAQAHFALSADKFKSKLAARHLRVFRRKTGMWLECLERDSDNTRINRRRFLGPVELMDGDTIKIADIALSFSLKDAC